MKVSSHVDWISVTIPHNHEYKLPPSLRNIPYKESKPRHGYKVARKFVNGVVEYSMPVREVMGTHIVYSGKALAEIEKTLEGEHNPMHYHWFYGHRFSRIDFAVDMKGDDIPDIRELAQEFEEDTVKTNVRSQPKIISSGLENLETMYIGSMKKRTKLLRLYRKDIQLGDYSEKWLRAELECRQKQATSAVNEFMVVPRGDIAIKSLVNGFCEFQGDKWRNAMGKDSLNIPVSEHKQGNTVKWLLESVAPALAREYLNDERFLDVFIDRVKEHMSEYSSQGS